MWLDVLGIVLPVLATIVAAVIAKRSASKELKLKFEHLQKQWEHERELAAESRFSEMAAAVSKTANAQEWYYRVEAISQVASIRAETSGALADALDQLYDELHGSDRKQIEAALTSAVQLYREQHHKNVPN